MDLTCHLNEPTSLRFRGCVFDLDGVITKTSHLHVEAWKNVFDDFLKRYNGEENFHEFTMDDYLKYVDGRPRSDGIREFLGSRNIQLPEGKPTDFEESTVHGIGNKKNKEFLRVLEMKGVYVYDYTVKLIEKLRHMNIAIGVASSSKNCGIILKKAVLERYFEGMFTVIIFELNKFW